MVSFRVGFLLFALLLAVAGLALGLTQAFNSDQKTILAPARASASHRDNRAS